MKKYFSIFAVMILAAALMLTACGGSGSSDAEEPAADEGQNPVMNYVGNYVCGRASVLISATDDKDGASALVTWSSSAAENSTWEMSGTFDAEAKQFEYHDCVRKDFAYKEDGSVDKETEVYVGGHGFMFFDDSGDMLTMTWQDDQEDVAKDMKFLFATAPDETGESDESGESAGMANPWQTADSAEAAAKGAGLDMFGVPEGITISVGDLNDMTYRYMDGIAEVNIPVAAVDLTIRKGTSSKATDGDISGDYNEYTHSWTQNIKGLEVRCFGNRGGDATKAIWQVDDMCYAITAYGRGGDDDFGLKPDDLNSLINGIQ